MCLRLCNITACMRKCHVRGSCLTPKLQGNIKALDFIHIPDNNLSLHQLSPVYELMLQYEGRLPHVSKWYTGRFVSSLKRLKSGAAPPHGKVGICGSWLIYSFLLLITCILVKLYVAFIYMNYKTNVYELQSIATWLDQSVLHNINCLIPQGRIGIFCKDIQLFIFFQTDWLRAV